MSASTFRCQSLASLEMKSHSRESSCIRPQSSCSPEPGPPATPVHWASQLRRRKWRFPPTCQSTSKSISATQAARTSSRPALMYACPALHTTWQKPSRMPRIRCAPIRKPCTATSMWSRTSLPPKRWRRSSSASSCKSHLAVSSTASAANHSPSEYSMSKPLADKVALVTGGSRGIGAAIARRLARDGAHVAISYSASADRAEALVKELKDLGARAAAFQADQADPIQVEALVNNAARHFGKLDILVNNAGVLVVGQVGSPDSDIAAVERQFAINVGGVAAAVRAAVPLISDHGRIISIGSGAADRTPWPGVADYSATKAAVSAYTRSEEHTSELQSLRHLVCRLLLEKKKKHKITHNKNIKTRAKRQRKKKQRMLHKRT